MAKHKCETCGKSFDLKSYLTKHEKRHKTENPTKDKMKPLRCSMCDKVFPRVSHLQRHQLTHFNVRDFSCDFCDEKFVQKVHLTRHIARKHPDEANDVITWMSCDKCGHLFRSLFEMKRHRKSVHTRFQCKRCSERIEGHDAMRKHEMRCRNGQNECGHCGASFGRPADLRAHRTSCLNKVAFVCTPCEEFFKQRVQLDRHIKKLHFRSSKCSSCEHVSDSPVQNARHSLECQKVVICGYCNHRDPDENHVSDHHWQRLKRSMSVRKATKEAEKRKSMEAEIQRTLNALEEASKQASEDSDDLDQEDLPGSSLAEEGPEEESEESKVTSMLLDDFAESSNLNFSSSAFAEDDDEEIQEEYLTFSIQPTDSDLTFYLRGRLPTELRELFPVLEDTSIVLLNSSTSTSRSRMLVQIPVIIPRNSEKEEEMRKWLKNPIFLE